MGNILHLAIFIFISSLVVAQQEQQQQQVVLDYEPQTYSKIQVAIIGAGAAGSSAAFHLSLLDQANLFNISILERNDYVGGRTTTINIEDEIIELGAGIFVSENIILSNAAEMFNLTVVDSDSGSNRVESYDTCPYATFDGEDIVFQFNSFSAWKQALQLLWTFGVSPTRAWTQRGALLQKFLKLYDKSNFPWTDLTKVVGDLGLNESFHTTAYEYFTKRYITKSYNTQIIGAMTRAIMAMDVTKIHGLAAAVCMTGSANGKHIEGGNYQIFEQMIEASGANLYLNNTVKKIEYRNSSDSQQAQWIIDDTEYDYVVMASPLNFSAISLPDHMRSIPTIEYIDLYVTVIVSVKVMNGKYFGYHESRYTNIVDIGADHRFEAIHHIGVTKKGDQIYKIFSRQALSLQESSTLLGLDPRDFVFFKTFEWYAYPEMISENVLVSPELEHKFFYTGGMDPLISTMETNALSGKNAAYLVWENVKKSNF